MGDTKHQTFFERHKDAFLRALEHHLARPEVEPVIHRLGRRGELSRRVEVRTRVYLDTKYWLRLRDHVLGRPTSAATGAIHETLLRGVRDDRLVVPATDSLISEVALQRDDGSRAATAGMLDELANGIAIVGSAHRVEYEFHHFFSGPQGVEPRRLVWTWVLYLFGELAVRAGVLPEEVHRVVEKVSEDLAPRVRVSDLMNWLGVDPQGAAHLESTARRLNLLKEKQYDPSESFEELRIAECLGFVNSVWDQIAGPLAEPSKAFCGFEPGALSSWVRDEVKSRIAASLRDGSLGTRLPAMQVTGSAYAAIWHDARRQYKKGDKRDIEHAAAALPYCDAFLTDRSMRHLLTTEPLDLDRRFRCRVLAEDEEVLAFLHQETGIPDQDDA